MKKRRKKNQLKKRRKKTVEEEKKKKRKPRINKKKAELQSAWIKLNKEEKIEQPTEIVKPLYEKPKLKSIIPKLQKKKNIYLEVLANKK